MSSLISSLAPLVLFYIILAGSIPYYNLTYFYTYTTTSFKFYYMTYFLSGFIILNILAYY